MQHEEPITETLRRRTSAQEQAERDALAEAASAEDALKHKRRADKAAYLRAKLEQQSRADEQRDS